MSSSSSDADPKGVEKTAAGPDPGRDRGARGGDAPPKAGAATHESVLSADELRALQGEPDLDPDAPRPFDFSRPRVLRRQQHQGLDATFARAAREIGVLLRDAMRADVTVEYLGGDVLPFEEFLGGLGDSFNLFAVGYRGMELNGVLVPDPALAFRFVEVLLGGPVSGEVPERSLTVTESAVASKLVEGVLARVHGALRSLVDVPFSIGRFLNRRNQFDTLRPPALCYCCRWEVHRDETLSALRYYIPLKVLRPVVQKLTPSGTGPRAATGGAAPLGRIGRSFLGVDLGLVALVAGPPLSFANLSSLQPGDVLSLGRSVDHAVRVSIEGIPKITGTLGLHEGRYAVVVRGWDSDRVPGD